MKKSDSRSVSTDDINIVQAAKFAKKFNLSGLRMENGIWVADDGDYGTYRITAENYWGAWHEGELA